MTSSAVLAGAFYTSFQARKSLIESLSVSAIPEDRSRCIAALSDLRQSLTEATVFLPAYDRRQLEEQWKSLEKLVASTAQGTSITSKPKFSFAKKSKSSKTPSPVTSRVSTPKEDVIQATSSTPPHSTPSTTHSITNLVNTYITTTSLSHTTSSISLTLASLSSCIIDLLPSGTTSTKALTALYAENIENCVIIVPRDLAGSVMLSDLRGCVVIAGCQQFRIHDSQDCAILLDIPSHPIIERCTEMRFGGYPDHSIDDGGMEESARRPSMHKAVQDFDWVRPGASPNWQSIEPISNDEWMKALSEARANGRSDDNAITKLLDVFGVMIRR